MNGMGLLISAPRSRPERRKILGSNPRKSIPFMQDTRFLHHQVVLSLSHTHMHDAFSRRP
ncbi:hypothetical protein CORC01_05307 [Colletotrichum orchidophilum]|uniref:Uncharacterized protein n=1 Tax=Colletotrichum orchidophilum TaxID=1209926 RepID=A0A1G4BDP9_9PEZI|nr:uncharacterized protein CORC01_05307 [Colletotrichum orchidophilum]OHE99507.1 hypothetical protein CORC01_05307 [Colletotrichum orchidophilum]